MSAGSWVTSANRPDHDFPIQNLPYGAFRMPGEAFRCGVAIGDFVLDLAALEQAGLLDAGGGASVFGQPDINAFMALGADAWARVRARLTELLAFDGDPAHADESGASQKPRSPPPSRSRIAPHHRPPPPPETPS